MNTLVLAESQAVDLSSVFTTLIGDLGTQFTAAVPTVAGAAGVIVAVSIGVPLVLKFFKKIAH